MLNSQFSHKAGSSIDYQVWWIKHAYVVVVSVQLELLPTHPLIVLVIISGANYDTHSVDLFNMLSWDTLENRRAGAKSVLMYKILNDHTAPGLRGSFVRREIDQTNYHLRNTATDLSLPKPKREFLKKSFKYSGAMLWNQLPVEGKIAESLQSLKSVVG